MGFKKIWANSEDSGQPRYAQSKEEGKDQESIQSSPQLTQDTTWEMTTKTHKRTSLNVRSHCI